MQRRCRLGSGTLFRLGEGALGQVLESASGEAVAPKKLAAKPPLPTRSMTTVSLRKRG